MGENPRFFPTTSDTYPDERGVTLRDWFAGQALASAQLDFHGELTDEEIAAEAANGARVFYAVADAMLKARSLSKDNGE